MSPLQVAPAICFLIAAILGIVGQGMFAWIAVLIAAILMLATPFVR